MNITPQSQQLLPLFAYFSSTITVVEEFLDEYLLLVWQTDQFLDYPFHLCFPMMEEFIAKGWWKQAAPGFEIFFIHPLLAYRAKQGFKSLSASQQATIQDCFLKYYQTIIIPKSIKPYLSAPNLEAQQLGVQITQFEVENLESCISLATNKECLTADLFTMLHLYWNAIGQQEKSIRLMNSLLDHYFSAHPNSEVLPNLLFFHASNQQLLYQFEEALKTVNHALSIIPEKDNSKAIFFQQKGNLLKDLNRPQEAISFFKKAITIYEQVGDQEKMAEMYQNLGVFSRFEKDYTNFQSQTEKALAMYDQQNRQHAKGLAYQNLAAVWLNKGQQEKALELYQTALAIFKDYKDELNYANVCKNIGTVYLKNRNFNPAKIWLQKALEIYLVKGTKEEQALSWFNYGALALDQGNFPESLTYYKRALKAYTSPKNKGETHHLIAYIHHHYLQNPVAALADYQKAITHLQATTKDDEWFKLHLNYGNASFELKQYNKAIQHYKIAIGFIMAVQEITNREIAYLYHNATLAFYHNQQLEEGANCLQKTKMLYEEIGDKDSWIELLDTLKTIDK